MKPKLEPHDIEARMKKRLREKGYKLTRQRLEIISLLARDMTHPGSII
jgi:Fe2+ or Zn2+ uptake regulation protein